MKSKFFKDDHYIYECKTSPSQIGGYFNNLYLKKSIKNLRNRFHRDGLPEGYRYVFPVNYLDNEGNMIFVFNTVDYCSCCFRAKRLISFRSFDSNLAVVQSYLLLAMRKLHNT